MKHFFLAYLFPALLTAQTMELTEQLGKTVLYDDIALSPDGKNVAWVQSTAATTSKQTYIRHTTGSAPAAIVNIATTGERTDFDPHLVSRFEDARVLFHRRRKRPEAALDGKC